ncbi:glycoside hydrolase [Phytoactinopolyspora sp. XMNu-373]|uniref:Glycoside hydrolase n=1 Tax=Phytoactinopolyspora mesophila TaxID=2650750 RepID=A0A7K3M3S2_9ACTN|nr:glycoside hydrolase [Phytoactinopolyspora mesophila]
MAEHARQILEGNWLGHATRPSSLLYPHQWSWDSAFTAIGYAHQDQDRAETELRSLFSGQWKNGLLPHIVFVDGGGPYFPGPEVWATEHSPNAPRRPLTSGIVQPPVHATAVWQVYRLARDRPRARRFLHDMLPKLDAWHAYLHRERTRIGSALVEIWHPWESGMDNSPLWDPVLARIQPRDGTAPEHLRTDLRVANPAERPTAAEYDRYLHLVALFRAHAYDDERIRAATPFAVRDVLFNSALVQADHDLTAIARELGKPSTKYEDWARATTQAVEDELWQDGSYADVDVVTGEVLDASTWSRFSPLFAGIPAGDRAEHVLDQLTDAMVEVEGLGPAVPSLSRKDPSFDPALYWRGPVWMNVNWFIYHGLRRYGRHDAAASLRTTMIELARKAGFSEHYHPSTGHGHGGAEFSWSAALVLDLLGQPAGGSSVVTPIGAPET